MKTAIQEAIEKINEQIRKSAHNELETNRSGDYRIGLNKAINILEDFKELEKQQIIDAYKDGVTGDSGSINSEQYYNQTFNK
jgi:hypothetical protein